MCNLMVTTTVLTKLTNVYELKMTAHTYIQMMLIYGFVIGILIIILLHGYSDVIYQFYRLYFQNNKNTLPNENLNYHSSFLFGFYIGDTYFIDKTVNGLLVENLDLFTKKYCQHYSIIEYQLKCLFKKIIISIFTNAHKFNVNRWIVDRCFPLLANIDNVLAKAQLVDQNKLKNDISNSLIAIMDLKDVSNCKIVGNFLNDFISNTLVNTLIDNTATSLKYHIYNFLTYYNNKDTEKLESIVDTNDTMIEKGESNKISHTIILDNYPEFDDNHLSQNLLLDLGQILENELHILNFIKYIQCHNIRYRQFMLLLAIKRFQEVIIEKNDLMEPEYFILLHNEAIKIREVFINNKNFQILPQDIINNINNNLLHPVQDRTHYIMLFMNSYRYLFSIFNVIALNQFIGSSKFIKCHLPMKRTTKNISESINDIYMIYASNEEDYYEVELISSLASCDRVDSLSVNLNESTKTIQTPTIQNSMESTIWRVEIRSVITQYNKDKKDFVFMIYVTTSMNDRLHHWEVSRSYTDFYHLEKHLKNFYGSGFTIELPAKRSIFKPDFNFLNNNKKNFENFLNSILQNPVFKYSKLVSIFLNNSSKFTPHPHSTTTLKSFGDFISNNNTNDNMKSGFYGNAAIYFQNFITKIAVPKYKEQVWEKYEYMQALKHLKSNLTSSTTQFMKKSPKLNLIFYSIYPEYENYPNHTICQALGCFSQKLLDIVQSFYSKVSIHIIYVLSICMHKFLRFYISNYKFSEQTKIYLIKQYLQACRNFLKSNSNNYEEIDNNAIKTQLTHFIDQSFIIPLPKVDTNNLVNIFVDFLDDLPKIKKIILVLAYDFIYCFHNEIS